MQPATRGQHNPRLTKDVPTNSHRTYILIFIYPTKAAVKKTKSKTALQSQVIHDVEESSCLSLVYSAITYTALSSLTDNIMLQAIFGLFIYIHAALLSVLLNSSSTLH